MIKHRKIIISILLAYSLFIIGIFNVRAEVIDTQFWDISLCGYGTGHDHASWNSNIMMYQNYVDGNIGDNTACTGYISLTNMSNFSELSLSGIVGMDTRMQLNGIWITDAGSGNSYACQFYDTNMPVDTGTGTKFYNIICDNLGYMTGNGGRVGFSFTHYGSSNRHYFYISKFYRYKSNNKNTSDIAQNTSDINSSINDSSIDNNNTSSSTTSWGNKNATNGTITNLLTLPISLLQAIVNGIQSSCTSFNLGSLFGTNIVLPCINIGSLIGSGLWSTIDILFSGFMILAISKKLIKIFNDFTNLKTNQVDELYGGGK